MINKALMKETDKKYIYTSIALTILNSINIVINAYLLAYIVNSVFINKSNISSLYMYVIAFIVNAFIRLLLNIYIDNKVKTESEKIKEKIKKRLFKNILKASPLKLKSKKVGNLISLITEGMESITPYYSTFIPQAFTSVITPLVIIITTLFVDPLSALIMGITYPIIPLFMMLIGNKSKEISEKQFKKLFRLSSHFVDMLQGLSTLKIFGVANLQEKKIFKISEEYRKATMAVLRVTFLSALVLELAATISTAVVAVDLGLRLVYSKISFLEAFFILILAPDFYLPMRMLGLRFHASLNGKVAIEKVEELEEALKSNDGEIEFNSLDMKLELKNLNFNYEGVEVLKNINLEINKNEKIALIGESGGGKTTLINILAGLETVKDDCFFVNGVDINTIDKKYYNNSIAFLNQFPHMFNDSIKENILMGQEFDEDKFNNICKLSKVDEFVNKLSISYDHKIGDGENLFISGGEKQRISLARAMMKRSEIIIMDEPTSALDTITEEAISNVISSIEDKTIIVSSHRLNTIKSMDKILFIKNGEIVESGSHHELIALKGNYYNYLVAAEVLR